MRPATRSDVAGLFGGVVPATMRAFVLVHQGAVLAVGGVAHEDTGPLAFSRVAHGAREIPGAQMALGRLAVRVRALIDSTAGDVVAEQDMSEPTSSSLLEWCGFEPQGGGIWLKAGK